MQKYTESLHLRYKAPLASSQFPVFLRQLSGSGSNTKADSPVKDMSNNKQKKTRAAKVVHWTQATVGDEAEAKAIKMRKNSRASCNFWRNNMITVTRILSCDIGNS